MKTFLTILLLFSTQIFAATPQRIQQRKVQKEINEVNSFRAKQATVCARFTNSQDQASCNFGIDKVLSGRVEGIMSGAIVDLIETKPSEDLTKEIKEEKCVARLQSDFTACGWTFNGTENCKQLKAARKVNGVCNMGSGSGSG